MVRPVPMVHIDFGNGHVLTRTLHGNIASYFCTADGNVVDILPGIYTSAAYANGLIQIGNFALGLAVAGIDVLAQLRRYHQQLAAAIQNGQVANLPQMRVRRDFGKSVVETRVERAIGAFRVEVAEAAQGGSIPAGPALGKWDALVADTRRNESQRRLLIHERLAASVLVRPEAIKNWLYKNVLESDLDDPYLGLGDALQGNEVLAR